MVLAVPARVTRLSGQTMLKHREKYVASKDPETLAATFPRPSPPTRQAPLPLISSPLFHAAARAVF